MIRIGSIHKGVMLASLTAGPIFLTAAALAFLYLTIPAPIVIRGDELAGFMGLLLLASVFGFIIALLPNLIGAAAMVALADRCVAARLPVVWTLVGGGIGLVTAALLGSEIAAPAFSFGLIAAAAGSARLCRASVDWRPAD